jgi:hypothetical protein
MFMRMNSKCAHQLSFMLAHIARKSHHATPAQPYNPHSVAATEPRGSVQPGLFALSPRERSSDRSGSADETLFVRQPTMDDQQ